MRIQDVVDRLGEKQRKTVMKCVERCGLPELDAEIEPGVPNDVTEFLKIIANPLRFKILKLTRDQWLCVCLLSEVLGEDQTLISHHLRVLKKLDLLEERKEGRMRFYRARGEVIEDYLKKVREELLGEP